MNRRRFLGCLAAGLLAAQMHLPLGALPRILAPEPVIGGVLTPEMLRRAVALMKERRVPQGPVIYWIHPAQKEASEQMFREVERL